jgi:glycosyltransferase involved in cell wall biosynthesis
MNRGGAETWLMHMLRRIDRQKIQMDFLVHTNEPAAYDAELLELGSKLLHCAYTHDPLRYAGRFLKIVKRHGPYDVLHSHVHHFSGYVLALGRAAGIPVRISHSHNDTRVLAASAGFLRRFYLKTTRRLVFAYCTRALAASSPAALDLFGPHWDRDQRVSVLPCGIDLEPFRQSWDRSIIRAEFGICAQDVVFGHVGRFDPQKNHVFLIDVAAEVVKREPKAKFLLVGDGPLRPSIEDRLQRAGIATRVVITGLRKDVARLMMGAMDGFLFPSLYEGVPLALIEAQAARLPAVVADTVSSEAVVVPDLIVQVPLRQSAAEWAEIALQHRGKTAPNALAQVEASPFNVVTSLRELLKAYGA